MARRLSGLNDPFFDRHKSKNWTQNHHAEHRKGSNAKGPLQGMEAIRMAFKSQHTHCSSAPGHRDHQDQSFGGINRVPAHVPLRALDSFVNARHARIEEGPRDSNYFRLLTPAGTKYERNPPFTLSSHVSLSLSTAHQACSGWPNLVLTRNFWTGGNSSFCHLQTWRRCRTPQSRDSRVQIHGETSPFRVRGSARGTGRPSTRTSSTPSNAIHPTFPMV